DRGQHGDRRVLLDEVIGQGQAGEAGRLRLTGGGDEGARVDRVLGGDSEEPEHRASIPAPAGAGGPRGRGEGHAAGPRGPPPRGGEGIPAPGGVGGTTRSGEFR